MFFTLSLSLSLTCIFFFFFFFFFFSYLLLCRSYDEVYTLLVKDCEVILSGGKGRDAQARSSAPPTKVTLKGDMVKLVCQDAKIGQRPT